MKQFPSKLFPNCQYSGEDDIGFYDTIPQGFDHAVSLYLGKETVKDDKAVEKAAAFFDQAAHWDSLCRSIFLAIEEYAEGDETVEEYFDFYKEEVPEVFDTEDVDALSLEDMVNKLELVSMASHESGNEQNFVVDFTLGYDQILCAEFDSNSEFQFIAWES